MFTIFPRELRFFDLFIGLTERSTEAAREFRAMLDALPDGSRHAARVAELEAEGDALTHSSKTLLHQTAITPLDRGDIRSLMGLLDDVLDLIQSAASRVRLYEIKQASPEMVHFADLVILATEKLGVAVKGLGRMETEQKLIAEACVEVNQVENEADELFRNALVGLFAEVSDDKEMLKLREIYETLERVTDRAEDAAHLIEGFLLEYL
jgi:predicted phosphate transport protein (TIGR00153 family)